MKHEVGNRVIDKNEDLLKEVVNYYSKLYKKENHDVKNLNEYTLVKRK